MKEELEAIESALNRKKSTDIIWFAQHYLSHYLGAKIPDFHYEIYSLLDKPRLGIAAPRSFAKSTIIQIIRGLHLLLTGKGEDILTISASSSLAEEWVRKIKLELDTNEKIRRDFGDWYKWGENQSYKWTEGHITIDRYDGTIANQMRAKGRGCQIRGFRPTRIFCDDLEDEDLVTSEEQRRKLKSWFLAALLNTITNEQQLVVIGTILHPLALLNDIIRKQEEFRAWDTQKYKALVGGKSIWEERWPTEALLKRKLEIGSYAFQAEFQNEPVASDTVLIREEMIKRAISPSDTVNFAYFDPAISEKETADYSALVCLGIAKDGYIYEQGSLKFRGGLWKIVEEFINFYLKYKPQIFGIEEAAFQQVLRPVLLAEARKRKIYLPIRPVTLGSFSDRESKRPKDKFTRLLSVTHFFENGQIFLKSEDLIEQLLLFPTGSEDDLVDACSGCLHLIQKYSQKARIFKEKETPNPGISNAYQPDERGNIPNFAPLESYIYHKKSQDWRT